MQGSAASIVQTATPHPAADPAYLRIRHLSKRFGSFLALDDVSLDIRRGEFVCCLGPSGCGKTTLLRTIAGLETQSAGHVEQAGRDISGLPPAQRDFGIVFQSYALFPNLTVAGNVAYGLHGRMRRAETAARVAEMLDLVGLGESGGKYPSQLSGGQQQRVALARALATSPGLLLLDEPLSALDARVRVRLRHEIKNLQRRLGLTTVMVTHDQEEALTMADRIVVMNQGVIDQIGTPMDIYRSPGTPFVADFVGTMNFLNGTIAGPGRIRLADQELQSPDVGDLAAGSAVQVCLRPEDVRVRDVAQDSVNALAVRIAELDFLGSFCRAGLEPVGAPAAGVMLADFSINLMRDLDLAIGKHLTVALPPDRLRVFVRS